MDEKLFHLRNRDHRKELQEQQEPHAEPAEAARQDRELRQARDVETPGSRHVIPRGRGNDDDEDDGHAEKAKIGENNEWCANLYADNGKIEGYELEVFGEKEFFASAGLQAGDVVRSVNSIEMTNRRRAEYLISEFINDRVNVVVMDIERDGKPSKFIYQIR